MRTMAFDGAPALANRTRGAEVGRFESKTGPSLFLGEGGRGSVLGDDGDDRGAEPLGDVSVDFGEIELRSSAEAGGVGGVTGGGREGGGLGPLLAVGETVVDESPPLLLIMRGEVAAGAEGKRPRNPSCGCSVAYLPCPDFGVGTAGLGIVTVTTIGSDALAMADAHSRRPNVNK